MKKRTELVLYSIALIVIALCDLGMLVLDFRSGYFENITSDDALVEKVFNIFMKVLFGIASLSILINVYLAVKGFAELGNFSGGRFHIILARIIGIFNLILAVILGLALLDSTDLTTDLKTFGLCIVDMILMFSYAKAAKAVRNGEE